MKVLLENWNKFLNEAPVELNTYGDLRKQLELAKSAKSTNEFKGFALGLAMDALGISTIKSGVELLRNMYTLPDDKKTNTVLDTFLNVDDQVSAIVDDSVENKFLNSFIKYVQEQPADRALEGESVTQKLLDFLAKEYEGRTATVPGGA